MWNDYFIKSYALFIFKRKNDDYIINAGKEVQMSGRSIVTVDDIFALVKARALDDFNRQCAARKLGHWPDDGEAMSYFMGTREGYRDVLNELGVTEYLINTNIPPQERNK